MNRLPLILLLLLLLSLPGFTLAGEWQWDFDTAQLDEWEQIGTGEWHQVELPARGGILELRKSGKPPTKPVRKPANILLAPSPALAAFTIELEAKTLKPEIKGADIAVIFGYQDSDHFYYAHICNDVNPVHQVIMKVEGAKKTRKTIHLEEKPVAALKDDWQRVRITRSAEGRVEVFVDDMENPSLTAEATEWLSGRIGLGSFNDTAQFDSVKLVEK